MSARFLENHKIHMTTYSITSAYTTLEVYNANDCEEVSVLCHIGTVVAGIQSTLSINQSADRMMSSVAVVSSATLSVITGSSSTGRVERASEIVLTITSSTATQLTVNGVSMTQSTSSALIATSALSSSTSFGSTVGTTVDTGQKILAENLIAKFHTTFGSSVLGPLGMSGIIRATSGTTANVTLTALDGDRLTSGLTVISNSTLISPAYVSQQVGLSFKTDELSDTANYFAPVLAGSSVARTAAFTVIKSGLRYAGDGNVYGAEKIST